MKHSYIKTLILSFAFTALITIGVKAQESHTVVATSNEFTPAQLEINQGDTVVFVNEQGTHNVNGTQDLFPNNPVSFGNELGSGWEYTFVFNTPGDYNYLCDAHPQIMTASITVFPINSLEESADKGSPIRVYPNPTTDYIVFDFTDLGNSYENTSVTIHNALGAVVAQAKLKSSEKVRFNTSDFETGMYTYRILKAGERVSSGSFMAR